LNLGRRINKRRDQFRIAGIPIFDLNRCNDVGPNAAHHILIGGHTRAGQRLMCPAGTSIETLVAVQVVAAIIAA
jgi:hypothetical protein